MMTQAIQHAVRTADTAIAGAYLKLGKERNALMSFLFHSVFRSEEEMAKNLADPLDRTTVEKFRHFIEHYLNHGYEFVGPDALMNGLPDNKKYALITFDDGYFNNTLILPVLDEFDVPALFFIATDNVQQNKSFWWDALYRARMAQGASLDDIKNDGDELKDLRNHEIEQLLIERYGPDVLCPRSDIDRPFTPAELRDFARNPHVHLGNHTASHGILLNYTPEEVKQQVLGAQAALREMAGVDPVAIAYPNGGHTDTIVNSCGEMGLKFGFTVRPKKIPLPLTNQAQSLLRLGRFCFHGEQAIEAQCRTYRSDLQLYGLFRDLYLRLRGGAVTR
jgi:peptidoglycan/xylan/chitin deacetylase (PgdA/CDA1 family)